VEGNDFNLNGIADDNVTLTGLDTDGDGLDNRFDSLNSVTNLKGTSYRMGTGGTFTGDPAPGSRTTVQKKFPAQTDRDWRYVGVVLPVQFLEFTGILQNNTVSLNWTIIADKEVDHFEIERSTDNNIFIKTATVTQPVLLQVQQSFGTTDDVLNTNSTVIYYRLKVIGKAGEIKYSNVLVVRKPQTKIFVIMMPNPAHDYVSIKLAVEKISDITVRLINSSGKLVLIHKQKVDAGNNIIQLNNLDKFSPGVYTVQIYSNEDILTEKLIITK